MVKTNSRSWFAANFLTLISIFVFVLSIDVFQATVLQVDSMDGDQCESLNFHKMFLMVKRKSDNRVIKQFQLFDQINHLNRQDHQCYDEYKKMSFNFYDKNLGQVNWQFNALDDRRVFRNYVTVPYEDAAGKTIFLVVEFNFNETAVPAHYEGASCPIIQSNYFKLINGADKDYLTHISDTFTFQLFYTHFTVYPSIGSGSDTKWDNVIKCNNHKDLEYLLYRTELKQNDVDSKVEPVKNRIVLNLEDDPNAKTPITTAISDTTDSNRDSNFTVTFVVPVALGCSLAVMIAISLLVYILIREKKRRERKAQFLLVEE